VGKEHRGFASMDPEKQRNIAGKGGRAAHQLGTAHKWTVEEARVAGRKGAMARRPQPPQQGDIESLPAPPTDHRR
jgi:general stress protein YciG